MDKNHSGQIPPRTIKRELVQGAFVQDFVLGLLKIGGPRCVTYFWGAVPGCVTGGSKLAKNSVAYFMDGPFSGIVHKLIL